VEILVLASGSSGNAALVASGDSALLVDAGISALAIRRRLDALGRSMDQVDAILLTHEHSDHVRGIEVLGKRHPKPVWATHGTWSGVSCRANQGGELVSGREQRFGAITVLPVATSHDAREPVALVFDDGASRVALCTDTGVLTTLLGRRLADCDLLLMEANHDADMLRHGPYPWPLKQRIASRLGHLANHQSRSALEELTSARLKGMVALHLSEQNNRIEVVRALFRQAVQPSLPVGVATRQQMVRAELDCQGLTISEQQAPTPRRRATGKGTP
jgi:phosphoribosyl 1,2-cyclic phosphodiesterase